MTVIYAHHMYVRTGATGGGQVADTLSDGTVCGPGGCTDHDDGPSTLKQRTDIETRDDGSRIGDHHHR